MPLEPKDWVAGYAAIVATASLGWQVWNSYRARRPQVTLLLDTWRSSQEGSKRTLESVQIRIRNREDYAVQVDRLYFRDPVQTLFHGPPVAADIENGDVDGLPFEVPAREVASLTLRPSQPFTWRLTSGTTEPSLCRQSAWS